MPDVRIIGNDFSIRKMFSHRGWTINSNTNPDLVQFVGGEDVDPALYKEERHATTGSNPLRDARESHIFHQFVGNTPMAGICRGGQFLNVMCGGRMWQNVNNHAIRDVHKAEDLFFGAEVEVTSTHHQMMRPTEEAELLLKANLSTVRETSTSLEKGPFDDVESVLYAEQQVLCYQPHPEYLEKDHPCQRLYFDYIENFFGLR